MEIEDLNWWSFDKKPYEGCAIECPECKTPSNHKQWIESSVYCEDCGDHMALECPHCGDRFDHVWSPEFKVI